MSHTKQHLDRGAFPRSVSPKKAGDLVALHPQVECGHCLMLAEAFR
jgi:threonine dehydrogenase-like Zn-dependent dehydrogenase